MPTSDSSSTFCHFWCAYTFGWAIARGTEEDARQYLFLAKSQGDREWMFFAQLRLARVLLDGKNEEAARTLTEEAWAIARRSRSPIRKAQCLAVRARYYRLVGDREAAIRDATEAYKLAWCDGPPFAYADGLKDAETELTAMGEPIPADLLTKPLPGDWKEIELDPPGEPPGAPRPPERAVPKPPGGAPAGPCPPSNAA